MSQLDEFGLIRMLTGGRANAEQARERGVVVGIGDDAAVVEAAPGTEWVVTADMMVEEIHFNSRTMSAEDVGYKAIASNISDLAAMGAVPCYALVSIAAPPAYDPGRLSSLYDGIYQCADAYGFEIIGGDTTASPAHMIVSVTAIGRIERGRSLLRSAARPGDIVFVAGGRFGCSAAGLHWLQRSGGTEAIPASEAPPAVRPLVLAHRRPEPQVRAGRLLAECGFGHALNDISDGLASDAAEIAEASNVGIILDAARIPLDPALNEYARTQGADPLDWVLFGGEDYQLVGTLPADRADEARERFAREGIGFAVIGEASGDFSGMMLQDRNGKRHVLEKRGYNHFA
ncbi:thiamine-phosphate kinase [Paenibacillus sp. MSJ-34]|uniref:thiamine-phosphate kinase n=1 Tax=Paenibacillus sp. MSJ-34 TaxID=2841529 RepID=UPI001C12206D|nr:thiamine-phosphate kinase [Paenibacillus sp. MSJ-34]MBU5443449.1 thiamine-phosphate kinase [Paenibacillus sp. MSJ-34]